MRLNPVEKKKFLRAISGVHARRYAIVSSHLCVKDRQDAALEKGTADPQRLTVVRISPAAGASLSPQTLAAELSSVLSVPTSRAVSSGAWIKSLERQYSTRHLVLIFQTPASLTAGAQELLLDFLNSYKSFHLSFVFDVSWKDHLVLTSPTDSQKEHNDRILTWIDMIGNLFRSARRMAAARRVYEYPNQILSRIHDPEKKGMIYLNLGILEQRHSHNIPRSISLFQRSIEAFKAANPNHPHIRIALNNMGNLYISLGKYEKAEQMFKAGLESAQEIQDDYSMAVSYSCLGRSYLRMRRMEDAEDAYWIAAMHLIRSTRYDGIHHILNGIGRVWLDRNRPESALGFFQSAFQLSCILRHSDAIGTCRMHESTALWRLNRNDEARASLDHSLHIFDQLGRPYDKALTHHYYYRFALHLGDRKLAKQHIEIGRKIVAENRFVDMRSLFSPSRIKRFIEEESEGSARPAPAAPVSPKLPRASGPPMLVQFWGTRGSIPSPSPRHVRYGGNTACVSVHMGNKILILDAGTGIRFLGGEILKNASADPSLTLLISHTHWDHIQGFPFFLPAYSPKYKLNVYGPENFNHSIGELFRSQMRYAFFPVRLGAMKADIRFFKTRTGVLPVDAPCRVTAFVLSHPVLVYGYRIEYEGRTLVYATDTEWLRQDRPPLLKGQKPDNLRVYNDLARIVNKNLDPFFAAADMIIFDAMYTDLEIQDKTGWGHSSLQDALDLAAICRPRRLVFFHHDPARDDSQMIEMEKTVWRGAKTWCPNVHFEAAREGRTIRL